MAQAELTITLASTSAPTFEPRQSETESCGLRSHLNFLLGASCRYPSVVLLRNRTTYTPSHSLVAHPVRCHLRLIGLGRWKTISMVLPYAHHQPESLRGRGQGTGSPAAGK